VEDAEDGGEDLELGKRTERGLANSCADHNHDDPNEKNRGESVIRATGEGWARGENFEEAEVGTTARGCSDTRGLGGKKAGVRSGKSIRKVR